MDKNYDKVGQVLVRDDTHMTSIKMFQFSGPPTPLSIYVQNSSMPLTLDIQFQRIPLPPSFLPSFQIITNQKSIIQGWLLYMLSGPSFRSAFVFIINSLILSGFPLTSFHLAEASLSTFCGFIPLRVQLSKTITKCLLFAIIYIFNAHFGIDLLYLHNMKT